VRTCDKDRRDTEWQQRSGDHSTEIFDTNQHHTLGCRESFNHTCTLCKRSTYVPAVQSGVWRAANVESRRELSHLASAGRAACMLVFVLAVSSVWEQSHTRK
jgi:hypothetical protein